MILVEIMRNLAIRGMPQMNGLRVYTPAPESDPKPVSPVFYSRRGYGPIYRWLYDDKLARWRPSRISKFEFTGQAFDAANWKSLPTSLKTRLDEHYLE